MRKDGAFHHTSIATPLKLGVQFGTKTSPSTTATRPITRPQEHCRTFTLPECEPRNNSQKVFAQLPRTALNCAKIELCGNAIHCGLRTSKISFLSVISMFMRNNRDHPLKNVSRYAKASQHVRSVILGTICVAYISFFCLCRGAQARLGTTNLLQIRFHLPSTSPTIQYDAFWCGNKITLTNSFKTWGNSISRLYDNQKILGTYTNESQPITHRYKSAQSLAQHAPYTIIDFTSFERSALHRKPPLPSPARNWPPSPSPWSTASWTRPGTIQAPCD